MTITRVHVLAIVAGILLPISGPVFAAHQSRHPLTSHSLGTVKENLGVVTSPSRVPAFDPGVLRPIRLARGSISRTRIVRMATPITGSSRDQETSGNGIQSASALGQMQTCAVRRPMSTKGLSGHPN